MTDDLNRLKLEDLAVRYADIESLKPANTPSCEQILSTPFHDGFDPR